jgi:hypothetical protein
MVTLSCLNPCRQNTDMASSFPEWLLGTFFVAAHITRALVRGLRRARGAIICGFYINYIVAPATCLHTQVDSKHGDKNG